MLDTQLRALSNASRRRLLAALLDKGAQDRLVVPEAVSTSEKDRQNLHAQMIQTHLPLLEEAGFVRWNWFTSEVRRGPQFEEIRPLLEFLENKSEALSGDWR